MEHEPMKQTPGYSQLAIMRFGLLASVLLSLSLSLTAFDTSLIHLDSPIYLDLTAWEQAGVIAPLPALRPYAPEIVIDRLLEASDNLPPDSVDAARAQGYLEDIINPDPSGGISWTGQLRVSNNGYYLNLRPDASFNWMLHRQDRRSTYAELSHTGNFIEDGNAGLPYGEREPFDAIPDWSDISVGPLDFAIQQYTYGLLSHSFANPDGNAFTWFSLGTHRSSAGPFHNDGIIISPEAPAAGHFNFGYQRQLPVNTPGSFRPSMSYVSQLSAISATNDFGEDLFGQKYMIYHNLHFDVSPVLSFGLIETALWGERFELLYLIPLTSYFLSQGVVGFSDNSLIGLEATLRPIRGLTIPLVLYADDIHFNDIVSFNLDTKYKFAAQGGVTWTPLQRWIRSLSLDYTAVMPYMYTHYDRDAREADSITVIPEIGNYSNYTNRGISIGPGLDPNSDRLRLQWDAYPVRYSGREYPGLFRSIGLSGEMQFIRHGNASAGIIPGGTGDIFDPGYDNGKATFQPPYDDPTGQPYTRFLTQDLLQYTFQMGLGVETAMAVFDRFVLEAALYYTLEQIWNDGLVNGNNATNNHLRLTVFFGPELR
jgi:hypothetical protein